MTPAETSPSKASLVDKVYLMTDHFKNLKHKWPTVDLFYQGRVSLARHNIEGALIEHLIHSLYIWACEFICPLNLLPEPLNMIPKGLGKVGYEVPKYPSYPSVFWSIGIIFK